MDPQACGEAIYNARHVQKLQLGQSMQEARQLLGRAPDQRTVRVESGKTVEVWRYLTNYQNTVFTVATFIDGRLVALDTAQK
jgi:hypothetical protein